MYKIIATTSYGKEVVEEDIATKDEAFYLCREYALVYQGIGSVEVRIQRKSKKTKS